MNKRIVFSLSLIVLITSTDWTWADQLDLDFIRQSAVDSVMFQTRTPLVLINNPDVELTFPFQLPNLPEPAPINTSLVPVNNNSVQFKSAFDGTYFSVLQNFSSDKGSPVKLNFATKPIAETTVAWLVSSNSQQTESVMNMGWRFGANQQLLLSMQQMRGAIEVDSRTNVNVNQFASGINYRYFLDKKWISGIELSTYASTAPSQITPTMVGHEEAFQRVAGSNLFGMKLGVETTPFADAKLKVGVGSERLSYDLFGGPEASQTLNTSIKWSQVLMPTLKYSATMEENANERKLSTGVDFNLRDGQQLGLKFARKLSNDGLSSDNAVNFAYTYQFGKKFTPYQSQAGKAPWNSSLIPEVVDRPSYLPSSVLAKPDSSFY